MANVTFRDMLWEMAWNCDRNPDASAGVVNMTPLDKARFTQHLKQALREVWYPNDKGFVWPETVGSGTFTITSGKISRALLGDGNYWSVWKEDPRDTFDPRLLTETDRKSVKVAYDKDYIYPDQAQTGTVYIFYRQEVPQWTYTQVDTAATYTTGDVVFDERDTGDCYLAIDTGALGSALGDITKWTPQQLPEYMRNMVGPLAESYRLRAKGLFKEAAIADQQYNIALENEGIRVRHSGSYAPWLNLETEYAKGRS